MRVIGLTIFQDPTPDLSFLAQELLAVLATLRDPLKLREEVLQTKVQSPTTKLRNSNLNAKDFSAYLSNITSAELCQV